MEQVSIITTVKDGEQFITETLLSVLEQSYENYEHIIVDDGSCDNTLHKVKNFISEYPKNKIVIIQTNGIGRGKALNLGVDKSVGRWIAILDADDLWHPDKLAIQMNYIDESRIEVLAATTELFTDSKTLNIKPINTTGILEIRRSALLRSNLLSHSSVVIKKSLCVYEENRRSQLDYELWLRLIFSNVKLYKTVEILSYHRIHVNQSFESKMGKAYRLNSFKLKLKYSLSSKDYYAAAYNLTKLTFDFIVPRQLRLKIKAVLK